MWKVILYRPTDYGMTNLHDYTGTSVCVHVGRFSVRFDCLFPSVMFMVTNLQCRSLHNPLDILLVL
jgi:hypothetical protein